MATLRDTVAQLYTPIYDNFMLEKFGEETQVMPQVYSVLEDTTKDYKVDDLSGLGMWDELEEGEGGNYDDPVLGYAKTYTHNKFVKKFQCSFESLDDDEYALLKKVPLAGEMGVGGRARVEQDGAQVLSDGFDTAAADGQYLWDSDHPKNSEETGTTYDNLLSGAFSHDNLETAESDISANFFTMSGIPIPVTEDPILLYPPALRGTVARVLSERALERPGTTNRDINRFAQGKAWAWNYKPVEWMYLSSTMGGSNTAWFIIFKNLGYLKFIWRQRPHFTSWVDEDLEYYKFKGRMRYSVGTDNWRCGFASTGA